MKEKLNQPMDFGSKKIFSINLLIWTTHQWEFVQNVLNLLYQDENSVKNIEQVKIALNLVVVVLHIVEEKPGCCIAHGGGQRCIEPKCGNFAQGGGKPGCCISHGGGKRCIESDCKNVAQNGGKPGCCQSHGRG